jgi:outer membrane beta-barrel protein
MNLMRWTVVLLAVCGVFAVAVPQASAQSSAEAGATASRDSDMEAFWATRRGIRTLQRRLYPTDGEFQLSLYFGAIPNDPFLKYFPIGLRAGYWVGESVSIELSGAYIGDALRSQTDLADFLSETGEIEVFLRDEQLWRANVVALWSPIYGKFSFIGTKLAHFDWFFGAGVGVVGVRNPVSTVQLRETTTSINPEVVLATGWNLHFHENWAARVDYRQFIFQKDAGGVTLPSEISLGVSFFF